jgi:hypothetical protein
VASSVILLIWRTEYGSINLILFPEMHRMKGFLIAAGIIGALYLADQQYARGNTPARLDAW